MATCAEQSCWINQGVPLIERKRWGWVGIMAIHKRKVYRMFLFSWSWSVSLCVSKERQHTTDIFNILQLCLRVVGKGIQAKQQWLVSTANFLFLPLPPPCVMLNLRCLSVNNTVSSFDHYDQPTPPCLTFQSHPGGTWKASRCHCKVEKMAKSFADGQLSGVKKNVPWFVLALSFCHIWVTLLDFNELRFILGTGCHSKQTKKTDWQQWEWGRKKKQEEKDESSVTLNLTEMQPCWAPGITEL